MSKAAKQRRIRFVAQRAMRGYDELSNTAKVELLLGLADILPRKSPQAQAARLSAWSIRASEGQQLKFIELLSDEPPPPVSTQA